MAMTTTATTTNWAPLPTRFMGARLVPRLQISASGFLLNARDGETFSLNAAGCCVLRALQAGTPPLHVWRALVSQFSVGELQAQRDAQLFLARLYELGLLELPHDAAADGDAQTRPGSADSDGDDGDDEV